jgi:nitrile hydratase accessory protein
VNAASPLLACALPAEVDGDRVFAEPWEAKAFAMIVTLAQGGHFSWAEWVECFSKEVAAAAAVEAAGGAPKTYYAQWLDAAEKLLVGKGLTSAAQLAAKRFAVGAVGSMHVSR